MRGRSYSYSPPARSYGRSGRSPSPRGRYGGHVDDLPTSLLVRNLRHDCRPEDLRRQFAKFGPVRDIYLPRDYYTREPRGFGFVQFVDPDDAAEAKYEMDGKILLGRELTVVFAEENRKKPAEMRARDRDCWSRSYDRGRSPRYTRSPRHSRSRSRSPRYSRSRSRSPRYSRSRCESSSRSRSPAYHSHRRRRYSRSLSPRDRKSHREWSYSPRDSRSRSRSPTEDDRTKSSYKERSSHYSSPIIAGKQQPHRERSASVSQ